MGGRSCRNEAVLDIEDWHQGLLDVTWGRRVSRFLLSLVGSFLGFVAGGDGGGSRRSRDWIGLGKGTGRWGG